MLTRRVTDLFERVGNLPVPEDNEVNVSNDNLDDGLQREATAALVPPGPSSYASMAAKTVANIKRLQVGSRLSLLGA